MQRRRLLRAAGAAAAAGLAGCIGGRRDPSGGTPTTGPQQPPTDFAVLATRCGSQAGHATVRLDGGTVTVEGTIWGNDACYTGRLESATVADGTLTVRVTAESAAEPGQGCAECITEIDYRATVELDRTPAEVVVVHRGEPVATATP